jgi:IclR family acetate operon transcriptional repressor
VKVPGSQSVNAVGKVLLVLEALGSHHRLGDIAKATGLPKSTVHRLLHTMVEADFAALDNDGGYVPGTRYLAAAGRVVGRLDALAGADPALRRLQDLTHGTVHLAVLVGDEAVYVRKLEAAKPYRMASRVGMALQLHSTAIGKAILAGLPRSEVDAIIGRTGLPARTAKTRSTPESLLADLAVTAERGWALDDEENERGVVCVGAAVRDHTGRVTAAVSVSQLVSDPEATPPETAGPLAAAAASEISSGLGSRTD